jgi:signal transduction histidine kinase/FixJ family two-component response regulator
MAEVSALALLRALDEGVASKTGVAFFPHLVCSLARTLSASCAFVSEIDLESYRANVLAIWHLDAFADTFAYALSGTPCECVLKNQIVAFPRRIQQLFPADSTGLARLGAESFLAIPLCSETAQVLGHIAVLDSRERDWSEADFGILRIFSMRAGAEIERRDYEKRLEAANVALRSANEQLREELAHRLAAEQQCAQAQRAAEQARLSAERANQAKSNFLAHMSHELRTPLNGILGYAQLLKRDAALGEEQLQGVNVIESSGEHLLTLINDLLDLAKIEAGRLELQASSLDLPQLLRQVADAAAVRARQAGLMFTLQLASELPAYVHGDERALRQVLLNLLGNAVKFTVKGAVCFRVLVPAESTECCTVRFVVEDTGPGIAPEDLPRIFEPFIRASIEPRVEGAGLGLPITKRLVDAMGGRLDVESRPGEGSRFSVELDLERSDAAAMNGSIETQITGYVGPGQCVLVVDDDASSREVLARLLAAVGLRTLQASSAAEALQMAAGERVDLLATDLAMPQMTGFELTRRFRADERLRSLPILAISASASAFSQDEALAAGCDAFIAKPVHTDELYRTLGRLLHLTWKTLDRAANGGGGRREELTDGISADERWTTELYDLAMKGDVKELMSRASSAALSDRAGGALYREVQRLARAFDMRGVRRILQRVREKRT